MADDEKYRKYYDKHYDRRKRNLRILNIIHIITKNPKFNELATAVVDAVVKRIRRKGQAEHIYEPVDEHVHKPVEYVAEKA